MNYANIKKYDIANGTGVRVSLFVSGCTHHCKGCFNSEAWDFNYGEEFTEEVQEEIIKSLSPYYIAGLSLLGGEPFEPENQKALLPFIKRVKSVYPDKDIWCWTGYTLEELTDPEIPSRAKCEYTSEMLECIDVLVDGEFKEELKDITLWFRGSSNQRVIEIVKGVNYENFYFSRDDWQKRRRGAG
jgi:anaerobic ribonucleoside-triphosphate reductase activating protein